MSSTTSHSTLSLVILAAGTGTRMKSSLPKPLHLVAGRPMLALVLAVARELNPIDITVVGSPELQRHLETASWAEGISIAIQDPPRGTADAVRAALDAGAAGDTVLVLYADHPLVTSEILGTLIRSFDRASRRLAVMTCTVDDAAGYGRIDRDGQNRIRAIVEKVDDDPGQRVGSTEINSGFMALDRRWAVGALRTLPPNPRKNEFFLTDLVAVASAEGPDSVAGVEGPVDVLVGVNDRSELAVADAHLRARKRHQLMRDGVTLLLPESNLIDLDVEIGPDTTVGPGCVLETGTRIGSGCRIGPNTVIRASTLGDRVRVESSTIEFATVGDGSDIGPYSHLRSGTELGREVHIGNFAELKNVRVGRKTRIGHFSYLGDAEVGMDVNIGAGTVTCNYDGIDKHRTKIGDGVFIGSDSMLIAPITIGAGARTGAGAVVTRDVAEGATVVGMPARQIRRKTERSEDLDEGAKE